MQVRQQDRIEIHEAGTGLAEAQETAAADINQGPRSSVMPDQVTAGCPAVVGDGTAGTQHLKSDPGLRWALLRMSPDGAGQSQV